MDAPTDDQPAHVLRIADTPDKDDNDEPAARVAGQSLRTTQAAIPANDSPAHSSRTPAKHRGRRSGTTQRLSAWDMAAEMARVDRLNGHGRPTIYRGS